MADIVSADLLEWARADLNSALTDSLTNSRTSASLACYVREGQGSIRLPYVPAPIRLKDWAITFVNGSDVRAGDVLNGPDGTYCVNEVENPRTYSVAQVVAAIQTRRADGTLNLLTNETVTFQRRTSPAASTATLAGKPVLIYAPDKDALTGPNGMVLDYRWAICFDPEYQFDPTEYFATGAISDNDQFRWVSPRASANEIAAGGRLWTLRMVVQHFNPYPLATAFFEEAQ